MRRLALLVPVLVALIGGTTACSGKTNGSAIPGSTTEPQSTGSTPTGRTTSGRPTSGNQLAGKDPCSLLTSAGQAQLGVSGGEKRDVGSARTCRWRLRGPDVTLIFDVGITEKFGIKDLPADLTINPLPNVGSRKAVQNPAKQGGACSVIMDVTDSSRVDTTVVAGTDVQKACDLALQMAKLVEPELPRG